MRAHALLSASSAHRWLECPPSAVAAEKYTDTGSDFAAEGTLAHEVAELVASGASGNWPEGTTAEMLEHAGGYRDYIQEQIKGESPALLLGLVGKPSW